MVNLNVKSGIDAVSSYSFIPTAAIITKVYNGTGYVSLYDTDSECIAAGVIPCDGRVLNSTTNTQYANLFSVIGTLYGGTGASSFNVPDLRTYRRYLSGQSTLNGSVYNPSFSANISNSVAHTHNTSISANLENTLNAGNNSHGHNVNSNSGGSTGYGSHSGDARFVGGVGNPPGSLSKVDGNSSGSGAAHVHNTDVSGAWNHNTTSGDGHTHSAGGATNTADQGAHTHSYSSTSISNSNTSGSDIPYIDVVYFIKI